MHKPTPSAGRDACLEESTVNESPACYPHLSRRRFLYLGAATAFASATGQISAAGLDRRYAEAVLAEDSLLAYWRLNGDLKEARGGVAGRATDTMPFSDGPTADKSPVFGEETFVKLGELPQLEKDSITVEIFFQVATQPTNEDPTLIACRDDNKTRFSIHVMRDLQSLAIWNGGQVIRIMPPAKPLKLGPWYHFAVVIGPHTNQAWLDGVACKSLPGGMNAGAKEAPWQIGSSTPAGLATFKGGLAEVAVYNGPLSEEQIVSHVLAGWERPHREMAAAAAARQAKMEELRRAALDEEQLFARGQRKVYENEYLEAISLCVGGVAAGPIQINGEGRRAIWQIFKNFHEVRVPDSFFAVRAKRAGGKPVVRAVQTVAEENFAPMRSLKFSGEYPFGWYAFEDDELPARVSMEVFSPMIPLNTKDSAIPCGIFNLTAENPTDEEVEVAFLGTQQNAIGFFVAGGLGGNKNAVLRQDGLTLLHMTTDKPADNINYGDMALGVLDGDAAATAQWKSHEQLLADFADDGALGGPDASGPSPTGKTVDGALASGFTLGPGEKKTVTFILGWYFPNVKPAGHPYDSGNKYTQWWPNAKGVVKDVAARIDSLTEQTRLYNETFYQTNLPYWLLDRITSQMAILSSMSCSWSKDGFFYGFEGCNAGAGCCEGNATHVWGYAQGHARLFPEIGRRMREVDLASLKPDGMLQVRFVTGFPAFDGMCSLVMSSYREHLCSTDGKWLRENWPKIKLAMEYIIKRWDMPGTPTRDGRIVNQGKADGMLTGRQHAMDGDQTGTCSWLGSMYLGALAAAEKMARLQDEPKTAERYRAIYESGRVKQDKALFNGEYYAQVTDPNSGMDIYNGCYIDQLLGQWLALQTDCGWMFPRERVRSAMASLFRYNFYPVFGDHYQYPRVFAEKTDGGMIQGTWPKNDQPAPPMQTISYHNEVMSGFEYAAAGLMLDAELFIEGLAVIHTAAKRYDGRLRTNVSNGAGTAWGRTGNPFGDDECGKFYVRSMAIWGALISMQGFIYDGPAGVIGFAPIWKPDDHVSFFTGAEGWGLLRQKRQDGEQRDTIEVAWGTLRLRELIFSANGKPTQIKVRVASASQNTEEEIRSPRHRIDKDRVVITLPYEIILKAGQAINVDLING